MEVVIYTRVSTEDQKENGYSLQDQERRLIKYCSENNFEVIAHYQDDYSAKNFNRPQFQKLLSDLKEKRIKPRQLICLRMDRFSRNLEETIIMTKVLKELKVDVYFLEGNIDLNTPESNILYMLSALLPQVENERRGLNTKQGMRQALRQGRWVWKAPKGYINGPNKDILVSEDAEFIIKGFSEVSLGLKSPDKVRKELNQIGFKCSKQSFIKILKDPFYTARILIKESKNEPQEIVNALHQPIIDIETFEQVQDILKGRNRKQPKKSKLRAIFPLRGHLKCKICGNTLTASSSMGRSKKYDYYHCQNGCKERIDAIRANKEFEEYLSTFKVNDEVSTLYTEILKDMCLESEGLKGNKISIINSEINNAKEQLNKIDDKYINNSINNEDYKRMSKNIKDKIKRYEDDLNNINDIKDDIQKHSKYSINLLSNLQFYYSNAPLELKHQITGSIFPEKLVFNGKSYRTIKENIFISLLCSDTINYNKIIKEKAIISDGLSSVAPPAILFSNQFKEDLGKIYELKGFIDVSVIPNVLNNPFIYRHYHPTM
jgi:site-specific DNA recombinase